MGSAGYFCCCKRRFTNAHTHGNGYSDSHADCDANTDANGNTYCYRNSNSFAYTHSDGDAVHGKMFPDAQATSHTCAEAIRRGFRAIS